MRGDGVADCKQMNAIAIIAYELLRELDLVTQMEHLLQLCMLIPLSAAMALGVFALGLFCREELKRLSRRGLIVLLCGGSIATVTARKNMTKGEVIKC